MENYELTDNMSMHRYEFNIGGLVPKIEYIRTDNGEIYLHGNPFATRRQGNRQHARWKGT